MNKVILKAGELDGFLTANDKENLKLLDSLFTKALDLFPKLQEGGHGAQDSLISLYNEMGNKMQEICNKDPRLHVYSFISPAEDHSEASRLIAKLRDVNTGSDEFIYYIQRAYELLFKLAWGSSGSQKNYLIVKTPVTSPARNYAVHKITNVDKEINNTVMCVMLRGALLPSMIMSKEIEEYSSHGYVTPFALFRIYRNDSKRESDMEYILDLSKSYINLEELD